MEPVQTIGEALWELLGIEGDADPTLAYGTMWTQPGVCPLATPGSMVTLAFAESKDVLRDSSRFAPWPDAELFPSHPDDDAASRRHARLYEALSARHRAEGLRPRLATIAAALVAGLPAGRVDLVGAFAGPFTVAVMGEFMGLPSPEWPAYWSRWLAEHRPHGSRPRASVGPYTDWIRQRPLRAAEEKLKRAILVRLHGHTAAGGALAALRDAVISGDLTDEDVLRIVPALSHTVISMTTLIAAVARRLLAAPELARAAEDPSTLASVIEESLRLEPPIAAVLRRAEQPGSIGGERVDRGDTVVVHIAAANRDPEYFTHANRFDPGRPPKGGRHLSFGAGPKSCAGAPLARVAAMSGIAALLARSPGMRLTDERLHYWPHAFNPGLQQLWVEMD